MRVGSLFSGLGGFDLPARWMGWTTAWYSENEPWACKVMAHHFPDAPNLGDITQVDWSTVERPDLLVGGFPCQPASHAGKRKGTDDERWLWPEFARAIGVLRPRWVLAENVPGLLTVNGGAGFAEVVGDLRRLGYVGLAVPVSAADMGAPHRRERIWIVAHAAGERLQRTVGKEHEGRGDRRSDGGGELGHADDAGPQGRDDDARAPARRDAKGRHHVLASDDVLRPWSDWLPVRGADGTVRLVPREALGDARGGTGCAEHEQQHEERHPESGRAGEGVRELADADSLGAGAGTRGDQGEPQPLGDGGEPPSHGPEGGVQPALWADVDGPAGGLSGRPGVRGPEEVTLWQTPNLPSGGRVIPEGTERRGNTLYASDGRKVQLDPNNEAQAWATPRAEDAEVRRTTTWTGRERHPHRTDGPMGNAASNR